MQNRPIIIGVTGGSGGGKTSVSKAILSHFPNEKIAMIEHDSYYKDQSHLTFEERIKTKKLNFLKIFGNRFNYNDFYSIMLER